MLPRHALLLVCTLLLTACGGDPHEKAANETFDVMEEIVTALEGVTDKASAEKARSAIEKLRPKMKEMEATQRKLGEPAPEKRAELEARILKRGQELGKRMLAAMVKINANPEAKAILDSTLSNMR